jgi:hypothetical protein
MVAAVVLHHCGCSLADNIARTFAAKAGWRLEAKLPFEESGQAPRRTREGADPTPRGGMPVSELSSLYQPVARTVASLLMIRATATELIDPDLSTIRLDRPQFVPGRANAISGPRPAGRAGRKATL